MAAAKDPQINDVVCVMVFETFGQTCHWNLYTTESRVHWLQYWYFFHQYHFKNYPFVQHVLFCTYSYLSNELSIVFDSGHTDC